MNLDSIKKQRHYFANKSPPSQSNDFSSRHVWMWELDCKESWALKNWCFWTVVLEKTLESPLDYKEIQPVHLKGNQSWIFTGRTDADLKLQYFGHLMRRADSLEKILTEKDWGQEEKGMAEDEMVGWHHRLNAQHEFEQAPGDSEGQGGLVCCSPWVAKSWTRLSDWTTTNWMRKQRKLHCECENRHSWLMLSVSVKGAMTRFLLVLHACLFSPRPELTEKTGSNMTWGQVTEGWERTIVQKCHHKTRRKTLSWYISIMFWSEWVLHLRLHRQKKEG